METPETKEHPAVAALLAPVDRAQNLLLQRMASVEGWLGEVAAAPQLSEEGKRQARESRRAEVLSDLKSLRQAEAQAIAAAKQGAEKAAMEPRHAMSAPMTPGETAALARLRALPVSLLSPALERALKANDVDTLRAVRTVALEQAARGKRGVPGSAESMPLDEGAWPQANLMERYFGDGVYYEPDHPDPEVQASLLQVWHVLGRLAELDEAALPEGTRAVRAAFKANRHLRRPLKLSGHEAVASFLGLDGDHLLR